MARTTIEGLSAKPVHVACSGPNGGQDLLSSVPEASAQASAKDMKSRVKTAVTMEKNGNSIRSIAKQFTQDAVSTIVELMMGAASEKVRLEAAREILNRGYGKGETTVNLAGSVTHVSEALTPEQRRLAALAILGLENNAIVDGEVLSSSSTPVGSEFDL